MKILWENERLKQRMEDQSYLIRRYGEKIARKLVQRLIELADAPTYGELPRASNPHKLKGNKKFPRCAVDVPGKGGGRGRLRLVFTPHGVDDETNLKAVNEITLLGIEDYH